MIWIAILSSLFAVIAGLLGMLPALPQPDAIEGPLGEVLSYAYRFNEFLPIAEMVAVLMAFLAALVGLQAYTVARKLISHFTGGGGA